MKCMIKIKKSLLILSASLYQVETVKTAKRLGYRVITTDNVPTNPGHAMADKSYNVDTTDMHAILDIACRENIDGVIAPCTDVAVPTASYVAEQLNLNGPSLESANILCDKVAFRNFIKKHKLLTPEYYAITSDFKPDKSLFKQKAWIIKPDRSSGSKGVFVLGTEADFYRCLPETLKFSPSGKGILEEFINGFQGTCEGIFEKGELALTFVLDRQIVSLPYVTTCGHHLTTTLSFEMQSRLKSILKEIFRLLNITDGPFDCDFVVVNEEIYILELTPRIGVNSISALL